jgi:hypothetical protein
MNLILLKEEADILNIEIKINRVERELKITRQDIKKLNASIISIEVDNYNIKHVISIVLIILALLISFILRKFLGEEFGINMDTYQNEEKTPRNYLEEIYMNQVQSKKSDEVTIEDLKELVTTKISDEKEKEEFITTKKELLNEFS